MTHPFSRRCYCDRCRAVGMRRLVRWGVGFAVLFAVAKVVSGVAALAMLLGAA